MKNIQLPFSDAFQKIQDELDNNRVPSRFLLSELFVAIVGDNVQREHVEELINQGLLPMEVVTQISEMPDDEDRRVVILALRGSREAVLNHWDKIMTETVANQTM